MDGREPRPSTIIDVVSKSLIKLGRRVIGAPEKGAGVGQLQASGENWGEGRFRRPRVTLAWRQNKENLKCNSRGDGGFIAGKAARGADTPIRWGAARLNCDETSPVL